MTENGKRERGSGSLRLRGRPSTGCRYYHHGQLIEESSRDGR